MERAQCSAHFMIKHLQNQDAPQASPEADVCTPCGGLRPLQRLQCAAQQQVRHAVRRIVDIACTHGV